MKKVHIFGVVVIIFAMAFSFSVNAEEVDCPVLGAGDLFKVPNNSAVYYIDENLNRLYFPNSEVYHSWFGDFYSVVEISPECVDTYPAPNEAPYGVNFRAGAKLVKVKISPSVYVVEPGNKLVKIKDESIATELYGPNWVNLVRDITDEVWPNYEKTGEELGEAKPHDGQFVTTPNSEDVYYVENGEMVKVDETPEEDVRTIGHGVFSKLAVRSGIIETKKAYERPEQKERNENAAIPAIPADTASSTPAVPAVPSENTSSTTTTPATPATPADPTTTPTTPAVPATPAVPGGSTTSTTPIDTTAPVISNITASVTNTSATIAWQTDESATSVVMYGNTSNSYTTTVDASNTVSSTVYAHSTILSGLTQGTTYYYVVKSTDASGNIATSNEQTFTIAAVAPSFVLKWGASGTGDGQFYGGPYGVDTDSQGNVYVLDGKRIQKFNSQGIFIGKSVWGTGGGGIAIDSQDNIYVVDSSIDDTVKKFDSNLNLLATIHRELITFSPWPGYKDIAIDSNDNLFIAARWKTIKMSTSGGIIKEWGSKCGGTGGQSTEVIGSNSQGNVCLAGQFADAQAIGIDVAGRVYVIEYWLHHIQVFDNDGNYIRKWGTSGSEDGYFRSPFGGAFNSQNYIYIADYQNNRIQKLTEDGTFILKWGSSYGNPGSGDGEFYAPRDVAVGPDGSVYVVEHGNYRVQKFSY